MGNDDELNDLVKQQIEEIMRKYDKQVIGDIPLSALFPIILNSVIKYEIREDIPQEEGDDLVRKLTEIGFPNDIAQELGTKAYELVPTREMKTMMDRAVELAGTYLPNLADEVTGNGNPYLNTKHGRKVKLDTGPPKINGDVVEVPIYLINRWRISDGEKVRVSNSQTNSGLHVTVEQPLGNYKISGPTREEFRQSTLEVALDYLASPPTNLSSGKT